MALVNHWDLQETSGTTVADSVASNTGTINSSVTLGGTGPGGSLPFGIDVAGTSTVPVALSSAVILPGSSDWTVAVWIRTDGANNEGSAWGDPSGTPGSFWLWSSGSNIQIRDDTNVGMSLVGVSPSSLNSLNHYTVRHNGTTKLTEVLIDGVSVGTGTVNGDLTITHLGAGLSGSLNNLDGIMSDMRVYDHQLISTEIDSLVILGSYEFLESLNNTLVPSSSPRCRRIMGLLR